MWERRLKGRIHTPLEWLIFVSLTTLRRHKRRLKDDLKASFWSYLRPSIATFKTTYRRFFLGPKSLSKQALKKASSRQLFDVEKTPLCLQKIVTDSRLYLIVLVDKRSIRIRHQNDEVTSVTHIEDLERHFLEDDLCDNNDDVESAN